jgi:hypothetical protein
MAYNNLVSFSKEYKSLINGTSTIASGTTFVDVSVAVGSTNYIVIPELNGVGLTLFISNKTANGFRINSVTAPATNTTVNWVVLVF